MHYKRDAYERPDEAPVAFTLDLVAKDLELILALADEVGALMSQAETNQRGVRSALEAGFAGGISSALAEYLRVANRPS